MKADPCLSQRQIEGLVLEVREARLAMTWPDPAGWVGLGRPLLAGGGRGDMDSRTPYKANVCFKLLVLMYEHVYFM